MGLLKVPPGRGCGVPKVPQGRGWGVPKVPQTPRGPGSAPSPKTPPGRPPHLLLPALSLLQAGPAALQDLGPNRGDPHGAAGGSGTPPAPRPGDFLGGSLLPASPSPACAGGSQRWKTPGAFSPLSCGTFGGDRAGLGGLWGQHGGDTPSSGRAQAGGSSGAAASAGAEREVLPLPLLGDAINPSRERCGVTGGFGGSSTRSQHWGPGGWRGDTARDPCPPQIPAVGQQWLGG